MAIYNQGFPVGYQPYNPYQQPYYPQPYQQPQPSQSNSFQNGNNQPMQPPQPVQPPIQNGGFISVPNESEARNYPVAPGNSVTFKDENLPYVYTKTMGFSQLDRPIFEKYRLVKEQEPAQTEQTAPVSVQTPPERRDIPYALKSDLEAIRGEIDTLKKDFSSMAQKDKKTVAETEPREGSGE